LEPLARKFDCNKTFGNILPDKKLYYFQKHCLTMNTKVYIKLGLITALVSFIVGSFIWGLYFLTSAFALLFIGYGFIVIVGLINLIVLFIITVRAFRNHDNRRKLLLTSMLMLFNIPVMLFYCQKAITLLNTMRITFTNETQAV